MTSLHPKGYDITRCCESVYGEWRSHQCSRKNGHGPEKAYCKTHDPVRVKERKESRHAKWDEERAQARRTQYLQLYAPAFLLILDRIARGDNDPRQQAIDILKQYEDGLK